MELRCWVGIGGELTGSGDDKLVLQHCYRSRSLILDADGQVDHLLQNFQNLSCRKLIFECIRKTLKKDVHQRFIQPVGAGSQSPELHNVIPETAGSLLKMEHLQLTGIKEQS